MFLVFRPYEDPISIRPYQPPDRGYYFNLHNNDIKIVRFTLEDNGFRDLKSLEKSMHCEWTIHWQVGALKRAQYESLKKYQKVNHFPLSYYLTRKDLMYRALSKMREMHGSKNFQFIPKTYIIPQEFMYLEDDMKREPNKLWICKPAASS
jgi:tubulin polyglutamylase TTLL5